MQVPSFPCCHLDMLEQETIRLMPPRPVEAAPEAGEGERAVPEAAALSWRSRDAAAPASPPRGRGEQLSPSAAARELPPPSPWDPALQHAPSWPAGRLKEKSRHKGRGHPRCSSLGSPPFIFNALGMISHLPSPAPAGQTLIHQGGATSQRSDLFTPSLWIGWKFIMCHTQFISIFPQWAQIYLNYCIICRKQRYCYEMQFWRRKAFFEWVRNSWPDRTPNSMASL